MALLLLAPTLLVLAPAPVAAQASSDPWFGPTDRLDPLRGYAVRIPLIVENRRTEPVSNPIVTVDIDFGKLLVAAGWTSRTAGADTTLRGFNLDVDSIRVVEYHQGFAAGPLGGSTAGPVPHRFYQSPFDAPRTREFDPERNPSGTLVFQIGDASFRPQEKRFYYVYANPLEYEERPSTLPAWTLEARASLDAYLWGTTGQVLYGFEPLQSGQDHRVEIRIPDATRQTRIEVYQYTLGRFTLVPSTSAYPNPFIVPVGTSTASFYVPANTPYKIAADRPIQAMSRGPIVPPPTDGGAAAQRPPEWRAYVPSVTGSFAGRDFDLYGGTLLGTGRNPVPVTVFKAGTSGTATVTIDPPFGMTFTLSEAQPMQEVNVAKDDWTKINSTAPVLVMLGSLTPTGGAYWQHQVPANTGGAVGVDFRTVLPFDGGYLRVCSRDSDASVRIVDPVRGTQQLEPEGPIASTAPLRVAAGTCKEVRATATWPRDSPILVYSDRGADGSPPALISLQAGAEKRTIGSNERPPMGPYGGEGGASYFTRGQVGVFGHFNDTRVVMVVERIRDNAIYTTNQTFAISADGYFPVDPLRQFPEATGRLSFVSTKPITILSIENAGGNPYTHPVPGRPVSPAVTLGKAEFRGPLVDLRSREKDGRQDVKSTGPGTPVTFPLEVLNLGRWVAGESFPDTITVTCSSLGGWTVKDCDRQMSLLSGTAERIDVTITPPEDALNVKGTFIVEARSKFGKVVSRFDLHVFVEIRYGVGLWFDVEGGRKTIDPAVGVDPGQTHRYNVVIKNTGSARDRFELAVEPDARPGWTQALLLNGEPVKEVTLEGGESRILTFAVTAPDAETAQQNIVSIRAQSVSSALAGDVVNTATRIRPKVSISMTLDPQTRVAEPNTSALFNITVANTGNDIFLVQLAREGLLPAGWTAAFNLEPAEVNLNPNPGRDPNLSYTFQLRVTPPVGSRAGDLATLKIAASVDSGGGNSIPGDEATAVVVVRKVHNVTTPSLLDAIARPGEAFDYVLPVTNQGNGQDIIELLPGAVSPDWALDALSESLVLDLGESADLALRVGVPELTAPGLYNLTFTLRLSREAFQNLTLPVQIERTPRIEFTGGADLAFPPGRPFEARLVARNTGNVEGAYVFAAEAPEGWNVTFRPASAQLAPGASIPVTVVLDAARGASDGRYDITLISNVGAERAGATALPVDLARPDLRIERVDATGSTTPGELVLVTATIRNSGSIAAENVSIALVVDGAAVDQVVLSRITVGDARAATLSWVSTKRTDDIRVVLDPEDEIVEMSAGDDEADVVFAGKLVPFPWTIAIAIAIAIAIVRRRRA